MTRAFLSIRDRLDRVGVLLSGLCAVHCLLGLLLVSALGLGGELLLAPAIHRIGLALAILVGILTLGVGMLRHGRLGPIVLGSGGIALMAAALGVSGSMELWTTLIALLPVAIVAGLVPLTFAGVGVRDAALVLLLSPYIGAPTAAALGVLFWLRYLVPGLLGSPLLPRFIGLIQTRAREALR